ncbi:MAG: peptidoglycan recognition family protein [Planctomycetia bacterium]
MTLAPRALRLASAVSSCALFVLGSCQSPKPLPVEVRESVPASQVRHDPDAVPAWMAEPLSWEKLQRIETWQATDGPRASHEWRVEAELELNRGRAEYARRDLAAARSKGLAPDASVSTRLSTARVGFVAVMSDMKATPGQRRRAEESIKTCDGLLAFMRRAAHGASFAGSERSTWGARNPVLADLDKNRAPYRRITVHHSAMPNPVPLDGTLKASCEGVRQVQSSHMDGRGYGDIGYHYLIDPYGRVFEGRQIQWQGAHANKENNIQNIGVCLLGNFEQQKPAGPALEALERVLGSLRAKYKIGLDRVYLHGEFRGTDCPGENLAAWVRRYRGSERLDPESASLPSTAAARRAAPSEKKSTTSAGAPKSTKSAAKPAPKSGASKPMPK